MNRSKVLFLALCLPLVGCDSADEPATTSAARSAPRLAHVKLDKRGCGTRELSDAEKDRVDQRLAKKPGGGGGGGGGGGEAGGVIDVYVHVITSSSGEGNVPASAIAAQLDVLDAAYADGGFSFHLVSTDVTANDAWFNAGAGSTAERDMKTALRQGDAGDLNLYTGVNDGSLLGWATFPSSYATAPSADGVVIHYGTLPGLGLGGTSTSEPDGFLTYDGGDTGTHEVGHWLGLYHTFQGGCNERRGDFVSDTAAEKSPQFYCVERDSCTRLAGTDPIHNFMDYVDDDCMDHFTPGQITRMRQAFAAYRL